MGTVVEITVVSSSKAAADRATRAGFEEMERIDALLSYRKPGSAVDQLNRKGSGAKVPVGGEAFSVIASAVAVADASGGAFDPSIGPLSVLWDFDHGGRVPADGDIASAMKKVGYKNIILDSSGYSVGFARDGMALDLGGIGKRFALDRAVEALKNAGVKSAIVDAGGDIRVIGSRPGRTGWRIGIQHPRLPGMLLGNVEVADAAVVTSGDYERFFMREGVRYHHILDPATGRPSQGCQSVTVVAPTAMEANSLAAFVLGPERGLAYLRANRRLRGLIVDASGGLHWTDDAFARSVKP